MRNYRASNHDVRIVLKAECSHWNRAGEAFVSGTIENLTGHPVELNVLPSLYLYRQSSRELGDSYWAPVDIIHGNPIGTVKKALTSDGEVQSIEPIPIPLRFKNKGDIVSFRIDARHLLWAKGISSVWPSEELFDSVPSDSYVLQLVLETDSERMESPKVKISIDSSKPATSQQPPEVDFAKEAQKIPRLLFPNAPEKVQSVDCFRTLKPEMSMYTVVERCGRPDEELGSGLYIFVWHLADGSTVSIGGASLQRIGNVRYTDPTGKNSSLLHSE